MAIQRYNSNGRFHEAVQHNGILYLSGQVAPNSTTITDQTKECLASLEETLNKYGSCKDNILSATIYLADMNDFQEFNQVWDTWVSEGTQPVRACVGAQLASPKFLVEIALIAAVE